MVARQAPMRSKEMVVTKQLEVLYKCDICESEAHVVDDRIYMCATCWLKREKKKDQENAR